MSEKVTVKVERSVLHLPAIALRGLVVFPNNLLHFEVGREKSIAAVEWAVSNNSDVFLVAQKEMKVEDPKAADLYTYGVVAEVKQVMRVSDDLVRILVEGKYRAKLSEMEDDGSFLLATVRPAPVKMAKPEEMPEADVLVRNVKKSFDELLALNPHIGKDVVFAVTVNSISTYDREKAREELEQSAKETYNSQVAAELIDTLKQSSTIKDAPSGMVDRMNQTLISNVTAQAGAYGMDAGAFVAAVYGGTADNYEETLRTYSQDVANQYMILAAIAEKENITVTDEEVTEDIRASLGADATDDEVASMMESIDEEAYREYLLTMKVCDFLAENAVTAEE